MKVVITDANLLALKARLAAALPADVELSWLVGTEPAHVLAQLHDADVHIGGRFTAEMAQAAPRLRLVHAAGAGTDKIDFAALGPDTLVANTFHHEQSIAEYIVAAAIMLRRGFPAQDRALRQGVWASSVYDTSIPQPRTLSGARIGFVGFGHIGQRAWKLFAPFGCHGVAVTGSGRVDAAAAGLE